MNKKSILSILLLTGAAAAIIIGVVLTKKDKPLRLLPYYGPPQEINNGDTTFHTVKDFSFINQFGEKTTQKDFENSIYVTDYFFVTCQSICPIMSESMQKIAKQFEANSEIKFLSHTVNPEEDSVSVLLDYATKHNAKKGNWYFVTGNKKEMYDMARYSYFLDAEEGDGGPDDFIHTQNFALVDKEKHIRGYYDGTNPAQMEQLVKDINLLLKEYKYKENN